MEAQKEMTLREYIEQLPEGHIARSEYSRLLPENVVMVGRHTISYDFVFKTCVSGPNGKSVQLTQRQMDELEFVLARFLKEH